MGNGTGTGMEMVTGTRREMNVQVKHRSLIRQQLQTEAGITAGSGFIANV